MTATNNSSVSKADKDGFSWKQLWQWFGTSASAGNSSSRNAPSQKSKNRWVIGIVAILSLLAGFTAMYLFHPPESTPATSASGESSVDPSAVDQSPPTVALRTNTGSSHPAQGEERSLSSTGTVAAPPGPLGALERPSVSVTPTHEGGLPPIPSVEPSGPAPAGGSAALPIPPVVPAGGIAPEGKNASSPTTPAEAIPPPPAPLMPAAPPAAANAPASPPSAASGLPLSPPPPADLAPVSPPSPPTAAPSSPPTVSTLPPMASVVTPPGEPTRETTPSATHPPATLPPVPPGSPPAVSSAALSNPAAPTTSTAVVPAPVATTGSPSAPPAPVSPVSTSTERGATLVPPKPAEPPSGAVPAPVPAPPAGTITPESSSSPVSRPAPSSDRSVPSASASTGQRPPERPPVTSYDVDIYEPKPGDTWESISREFYQDPRFAAALRNYNRNRPLAGGGPVDVPPLHVLRRYMGSVPTSSVLSGAAPAAESASSVQPAGRTVATPDPWNAAPPTYSRTLPAGGTSGNGFKIYRVPTDGLSLPAIARQLLGNERRWVEIYDLNPDVNASRVPAGTELRLPPDARLP
ncbi:MAG: hypothetical protein NZU63_13340 [Gemmataceae bacterium]|nr:hypothetical protein [Gemmataceae bacterium]